MSTRGRRLNILIGICSLLLTLFFAENLLAIVGYKIDEDAPLAHFSSHAEKIKSINFIYESTTNSEGIRYREIPFEKASTDEIRVVVVGDSFVEGDGVEEPHRFTSVLEKKFSQNGKKVLFVNCGISGSGPIDYWNLLNSVALKYHPDKVMIVFYANDLFDTRLADEFFEPSPVRAKVKQALHDFLPRIYGLMRRIYTNFWLNRKFPSVVRYGIQAAQEQQIPQASIDQWVKNLPPDAVRATDEQWVGASRLLSGLLEPHYWTGSLDISDRESEAKWNYLARLLERMTKTCREKKRPVFFIYAPCPYQYDPDYDELPEKLGLIVRKEWLTETSKFEKRLGNWSEAHTVPFLNLTPYFRDEQQKSSRPLNLKVDPHWTPRGHWLAAMVIERWLKQNHFL